jgi:hypothetical protein
MLTYFLFPILLCLNAPAVLGANYALSEAIIGPAFYDKFIWFYAADPSHGRVFVHPSFLLLVFSLV